MSSGGVSYHGVVGHTAKATLPSVSSWGTNQNILKDPPKSIQTYRRDRVGQTNEVARLIDGSGDRACEYIRVYPLGQNPMVGVSYQNSGRSSGSGISGTISGIGQQASLPYRLSDNFRPPLLPQEYTFPLSRLPRLTTEYRTNPASVDFTKKLMCPSDPSSSNGTATEGEFRQIKKNVIHTNVRPTVKYNIEKPLDPPFQVKNVIQNPIQISASSGIRNIYKNVDVDDVSQNYFKNVDNHATTTNPNLYSNISMGEMIGDFDTDRYIQETPNIYYATPICGNEENARFYQDGGEMQLDSKLPSYSMSTNMGQRLDFNTKPEYIAALERKTPIAEMYANYSGKGEEQISSRKYNLPEKPSYGGFNNAGFIPQSARLEKHRESLSTQKANISKNVMNQMMNRKTVFGTV
jgi:hypothetical protein